MPCPAALLARARAIAPLGAAQIDALFRGLCECDALSAVFDADSNELVGPSGRVRLTPQQGRIFAALTSARGCLVRRPALLLALVGDDPDGGPEGAARQLAVVVCRLRGGLVRCGAGVRIATVWGIGYRLDISEIGAQHDARPRGRVTGVSSQAAASVE